MLGGVRGGREVNDRNSKGDDHDRNGFLETHSDRSFPSENSFYAMFGLTCFGHRNALPPDSSRGGVQSFEESQQNPGVMLAVGAAGQSGFVAGLFGEAGEVAVEPPRERAEPEEGAMQKGKTLGEGVAAGDVRNFVRHDGVELGIVPFAPGGGQQNGAASRADGERHDGQFGFGGLRNRGKAPCRSACGESVSDAGIVDRLRGLQEAPGVCETDEKTREQNKCDDEINRGRDQVPRNGS